MLNCFKHTFSDNNRAIVLCRHVCFAHWLFWSSRYVRTQILRGQKHYGASLKTSWLRLDFPVIPLPWFSDFLSFCRRASRIRQCECVLRPELKYGIFAVQTQEKGRWKAELRYVFEFVSMLIVNLRFTSIVLTSWTEEGQVLISENHWNGHWILEPLIDACKWNFQETFYCDNVKWLIK